MKSIHLSGQEEDFIKSPYWRYWEFHAHEPPDHLAFVSAKYFAYVDWETNEWDALFDYDDGTPASPEVFGLDRRWWDPDDISDIYNAYCELNIPKKNNAWFLEFRIIHYDRVLAFDIIGDSYNEGPHLLVDYGPDGDPFESRIHRSLQSKERYSQRSLIPEEDSHISYFPRKIPDERKKYRKHVADKLDELKGQKK